MRKTKIVCTMGPATEDDKVLRELMRSGMAVARFNFSHGDHEMHKKTLERVVRLREELVDLWWAAYHAAMLLVLWALVATAALLGMQLKLQGLEPNWGVGPQSLMLLVYSDSFLHHLVPLADAAVWVTDAALLAANALAAALFIRSQRRGRLNLWPVATTIVTLYTFTIWLSDGTWMICLLAALAMAGCTLTLLLTGGERREV